jgi:hypothetical protein
MPTNALTATGLTTEALSDIIADLTAGYTTIYGPDINLDSNTPDGQMMAIYAEALIDNLDLLTSVYNQFSIQNAFGVQVDNLVALNGLQRQAGTQTIAYVEITASQAITVPGLDVLASNPNATVFTVADQAGNQYQLTTSYTFSAAGTSAALSFTAVNLGETFTSPNTITVIVTPLTGISSVNNPSTAADVIGTNEETDVQLKVRQGQSFALAATGPADTLRAQLLNIPGIIDAYVAENDTSSVAEGVPANGIWVIVNVSSATPAQIAQVIYSKKTIGCAQKTTSGQSYNITRPAGNIFTAYWDLAISQALYVTFTISAINGVDTFNTTTLATDLANALVYKLNQNAYIGDVIKAMLIIAPNGYLTSIFVGTTSSPSTQSGSPSDFQHYLLLSPSGITIST